LLALLQDPARFWPFAPVPSVPLDAPEFDPTRYWKGPTWVNTSWAVLQGLRAHGRADLADDLRARTIDLVARAGPCEYFSPIDGEGLGAEDFSWTAALTLDLLRDEPA
jgi:glycogen debranching enzyme